MPGRNCCDQTIGKPPRRIACEFFQRGIKNSPMFKLDMRIGLQYAQHVDNFGVAQAKR